MGGFSAFSRGGAFPVGAEEDDFVQAARPSRGTSPAPTPVPARRRSSIPWAPWIRPFAEGVEDAGRTVLASRGIGAYPQYPEAAAEAERVAALPELPPGKLLGPFDKTAAEQISTVLPRQFEDSRVAGDGPPTPLDPNGPRPAPSRARAIRMPDGKILLTNQEGGEGIDASGNKTQGPTYAQRGGTPIAGRALYDAVRARLSGGGEPTAAAASPTAPGLEGTNMEGPSSRRLFTRGFLPFGGFQASTVEGTPGGGSFSGSGKGAEGSISDNPDARLRLALEDAAREISDLQAKGAVAGARAEADLAANPVMRARIEALRKAPEMIGFELVEGLYDDLEKRKQAFAIWEQRASNPNDREAFVEPNQRPLRARMMMDQLGISGAEEKIKTLASIIAQQRVPYNQFAGAGVP